MRKMRRAGRKLLTMMTTMVVLMSAFGFTSMAVEDGVSESTGGEVEVLEAVLIEDMDLSSEISPYTMLASCIISVGRESDGMHIEISTGSVGTASVLGVKDVKVWKKIGYNKWELVAVSDGAEASKCTTMGISLVYKGAEQGETYKITCLHYGNVDGYTDFANDSGAFVYNFD